MKSHEEIVRGVCEQVRSRATAKAPVKIVKDAVSHFVPNPDANDDAPRIDLRGLDRVLEVDTLAKTCTAEAGCTFEKLVCETLKYNLVPMCVPELKGITVGGAISGCSIESMSYKHGGFHDSCTQYEVVTGDGRLLTCGPDEDGELFEMIHGSYGTLGILTQAKFKLVSAPPYVRMKYVHLESFAEFEREIHRWMREPNVDFIDGIVHAKDHFVLCLGAFAWEAPYYSDYSWLSAFYKSTEVLSEDYLRTEDYFFRYDAECHWLTKTVPGMSSWPLRLLLGKLVLGSTNLIKWSKRIRPLLRLKRRPEVV
ncbi:MAG TPA: FAD-binding oxidoreductase, partial [bacterium]|nr:FAD-binding oxidoreductase [bacterium]